MRFRSLLTLLFISLTTLGLVGCGSSGVDSEFVATGPAAVSDTGSLTFRFVRPVAAQQSFEVDAATSRLRFAFFDNLSAVGNAVQTRTVDFAPEVSLDNVPTSVRSVRITGLNTGGIPLYTITQSVIVEAGKDTIVSSTARPVAVSLSSLELVPANSTDSAPLSRVETEVGGTAQVYLKALYNDGTVLVVGAAANYSPLDEESEDIFSVGPSGLVRGIAPGVGQLVASFGGQSLMLEVEVSDSLNSTFSFLFFLDSSAQVVSDVEIAPGSTFAISVAGIRASDGGVLGVSNSSSNLDFIVEGSSSVTVAGGVVSVATGATAGDSATVIANYVNANGTTVSDELFVIVGAAAP